MPSTDLVSVVIPAFNAERFLAEAVQSVLRQRAADVEIVVIDDGSTDQSLAVAESIAGVRCYRQDNRGIAAARNAGVKLARGNLLAFLDADDLWTDRKLAVQIDALRRHSDVQIVAGRVEQFHDAARPQAATAEVPSVGDAYTAGAMLLRRSDFLRVGMFDEDLRLGEFIDWQSRALALGLRELCVEEVVLRRRIHEYNTTRRNQGSRADYLSAVRAHLHRKRNVA